MTGPQGSTPGGHRLRVPRVARCGHEDWETDRSNAEHIAGMDPVTTLALTAHIRTLEAQLNSLDSDVEFWKQEHWHSEDRAREHFDGKQNERARAEAAEALVVQLRTERDAALTRWAGGA